MDISLVVPCFNELLNIDVLSRELAPVIARLRREHTVELLFVDDGSTDGTGEQLRSRFAELQDVRVISHDRNRGLGAALRTGFAHCTGEVIVTTDSDATYPFPLILPLLELLRPGVDIVTASCYHPDGGIDNVPNYRVLLSRSASLMYRVLLDRRVHTYTCMFRAYRRRVIETVPFRSDGFLSQTELLAGAMLRGYKVAELPCRLRARRYGASKAKIARTVMSHIQFQSRLLATRVQGGMSDLTAASAGFRKL